MVSKDPRLLGGLLKMLDSGDAESSDAKSETNAASPDAAQPKRIQKAASSRARQVQSGALSPKQLIEAGGIRYPEEILARSWNPADMSLETLVELVTGYTTCESHEVLGIPKNATGGLRSSERTSDARASCILIGYPKAEQVSGTKCCRRIGC